MSTQFHEVTVGHNKFYIDCKYREVKPAGAGAYGLVVSALDTSTDTRVAIKKIKDTFENLIDAKRILREIKILRHFSSHENIVTILDIMTYPPNTVNFKDIYIVTNLMESDLEKIITSKQALTDQHFQYFLYQLLRGLKYIHSANVMHRDLKPSNLLVNANCDLTVCDFGLGRGIQEESVETLTEYVVTRWYRAPELLCENSRYGKPVDIWAVGCIFAELLTHDVFFKGSNPVEQLNTIVRKLGCPSRPQLAFVESRDALQQIVKFEGYTPPDFRSLFPSHANPQALDLLYRMLIINPDDRITVEEALHHSYLRDFQGQMPEPCCDDTFNYDFELSYLNRERGLTQEEVQLLMYEEMLHYRPDQIQGYHHFIQQTQIGQMISKARQDDQSFCESKNSYQDKSDFKMELDFSNNDAKRYK